ncbi:MAG TPA: META domain-containing protein [Devosia sp.]|nr:META domain-containing protein [Devosia sp.]
MIARSFKRCLVALLVLVGLSGASVAADVTLTGEVTYRERIALPPDAQLQITLVHLPDARRVVGAMSALAAPGQVPLQFTLNVRSDVIATGGQYGLVAEIRSQGRTMFRNTQPVPVDVVTALPVMILVNFSPEPPPPEQVATPDSLFETIWIARNIAGLDVLKATEVTFSIAPDRRAGGNGGCNSYFTEAMFDGPALRFGPVAGTLMACDSKVMQQEDAFFAALASTTGYQLDGQKLSLLDAAGKPLVQLVRQ